MTVTSVSTYTKTKIDELLANKANDSELSTLEGRVDSAENSINTLTTNYNDVSDKLNNEIQERETLGTKVDSNTTDIEQIKAKNIVQDNAITTLTTNLENLDGEVKRNTRNIQNIQADYVKASYDSDMGVVTFTWGIK